MKKISLVSFDVQHMIADGMIALGFRAGYDYKIRLDERFTYTMTTR